MARCYICDFCPDVPGSDYHRGLVIPHETITISTDKRGRPVCSLCFAESWVETKLEDGEVEMEIEPLGI